MIDKRGKPLSEKQMKAAVRVADESEAAGFAFKQS